jgi:acetyl-CoA C-acetyltransferase/acetyl-CoA acyltransferase
MEAVILAAEKVAAGSVDVVVCGGTESMSRIPMQASPDANPWFLRLAKAKRATQKLATLASAPVAQLMPRSAIVEGLTDPVCGLNMGHTAENLAREFGITREEQDEYALASHRRAVAAQAAGAFDDEIVPVYVGPEFRDVVTADVGPRANQSNEALAKLRPVFERVDGTVTAGNSCQITDGAAALVVASEAWALAAGFRPLAHIRSFATCGLSPARMGLGPAFAIPASLDRAGLSLEQVDRVEINEAFAAQVIACERALASRDFARDELGRSSAVGVLDRDRLNANGGAIALGHPIGATGARLLVTLLAQLRHRNEELGLASLCVGGGQGSAVVIERMS